jgi:hypothetical protein
MMTKSERVAYEIALTDTVQGGVALGLTRGDVDRIVALARVAGTLSLIAEVVWPGWEHLVPAAAGARAEAIFDTARRVREAVRAFDRQHPDQVPDLEARVEAAQIALSDLQPERL